MFISCMLKIDNYSANTGIRDTSKKDFNFFRQTYSHSNLTTLKAIKGSHNTK